MVAKEQGCLQDSGGPSYRRWGRAGAKAKSLPGRESQGPHGKVPQGKTGLSASALSAQGL